MPETKKIDVMKATQIAMLYFRKLYRTGLMRVRIEEAEMTKDEKYWLITIGYDIPGTSGASIADSLAGKRPLPLREYKEIQVDATTGEVKYMRIRKL